MSVVNSVIKATKKMAGKIGKSSTSAIDEAGEVITRAATEASEESTKKGFQLFSDVDADSKDMFSVYDHIVGKRLHGGVTTGIAAAALIGTGVNSVDKAMNRNEMGEIVAQEGNLSNMYGEVSVSPLLAKSRHQDPEQRYNPEKIVKNGGVGSSWNNRGAEGDIVFALHNIR